MNRRQFLCTSMSAVTALHASQHTPKVRSPMIKAIAFDAFAIFDPRSVFRLAEELFPGRGAELSDQWRTRQFEYTWLRNSMRRYADFWQVTEDALHVAAEQSGIELHPEQRSHLMSAYLELKPWPDVAHAIKALQRGGMRLALLSNMTSAMMQACVKGSGMDGVFEFQLSTDSVKVFKPDPAAYHMALEAFHLERQEIAFVAFGGWDAAGAKTFGYPTYWANRLDLPPERLGVSIDVIHHDLSSLQDLLAPSRQPSF